MTSLDTVDPYAAPRPATVAPRLISRLPQIAGVSVLAIGGVVLVGCVIDAPLLQSFLPGLVAMKANTAIGLVLAATALLLHARVTSLPSRQALGAQLCGLLVAALGGATVLEYLLGVDLRIDQLFLAAETAQDGGPMPGRMAAVTATALALIGGALLVPPRRQRYWPRVAQTLALAAGSLALAALLGYAYGAIPAAGSGHGIQIAPHAAIALVLLSVGKLALHADAGWVVTVLSPRAGGVLARRLLPVAFLTPLLLGGLRQVMLGLGWLDIANGAAATAVATMLVFAAVIWRTTSLLDIAERDWHAHERARLLAARAADDSISVERLARQRAEEARAHAEQVMLARAEVLAQLEIRDAQLTERTRDAESLSAELGAQRHYLRQVLDTIPSFVFIKNMEGEFTFANAAIARAYGTTPENLVGKRDIDFSATAEEAAAYRAADRAVAESGRGITLTEPITDAAGEVRWLETVKRPIDGVGREAGLLQVLGVATDITAYRRAEAALRESESALRLALETAKLVPWVRDLRTDLIVSGIASHADSPTEGHEGRPMPYREFLAAVHPDDRAAFEAVDRRAVESGGAFEREYRRADASGQYRTFYTRGRAIRDERGTPLRVTGVSLDVTARIQLEDQLRQSQKMEALGRLVGGIAHDFNNVLTVVRSYGELLLEDLPESGEHRSDVREICNAATRATTMISQLMALSRQQLVQPRAIDLTATVGELAPMLARLLGADVRLEIVSEPHLGIVRADPGQMEQVLVNLVVNARDAMPDGGALVITTANVDADPTRAPNQPAGRHGSFVELSVSDTGIGLDPATMGRIFDPFFTTKEVGKGTGLGLATVYGIVKQSGGHVTVSSKAGEGTTFTISLPCVGGAADAFEDTGPAAPRPPSRQGTVLVVDDDDAVRGTAHRILARAGYTVFVAANGTQALALLKTSSVAIDLVVTDLVMPEMGGRELATALRTEGLAVRVLFTSGYTRDTVMQQAVLEREAAFIAKPFTPDALLRSVFAIMEAPLTPREPGA